MRSLLVVGAGSVGRRHLRNVRAVCPGVRTLCWRLTATEADPELSSLADVVIFDEASAVATRPGAVIVAGPATTHAATALPFVMAGVPVLIEKPIAATLDDCDRILSAAREGGGVLVVGYCLRFHPLLQRLAADLSAGTIGRPLGIRAEVGQHLAEWRPHADWRTGVTARPELGGGALLELSHEFDYARWLLGEVRAVGGMTGSLALALPVEDYVEVLLQFVSGAIGSIHLDLVQRPMTRRCRVIGEDGCLELDFVAQTLRRGRGDRTWDDLHGEPAFDRNTMFRDELAHFLACAQGGETPRITGDDGRRALAVAIAARQAAAEGAVVHV